MTTAKCAHWGSHGAAGLLVADRGKVLLQLRSQAVREPHTWSIPGGARGKDETPQDAALREAAEETGIDPQAVKIVGTYSDLCGCGWQYTTHVATPTGPSTLRGNWEGERLALVPIEDVAEMDLHPGFRAAWPALRDIIHAPDTRPNITQLTEQLFTGGDRGRTSMATYLAQLQSAGITHVIDCRPHGRADQAYARAHAPQIGYLLNPQPDLKQTIPGWWWADGVDSALHALADPGAKVLIHCELGWNRGPSLAFAVLLARGLTPEQARATIVAARPVARLGYANQAAKWWANLTAPVAPRVFYHGGQPGMKVGDFLLPPTLTGVTTFMDKAWDGAVTMAPVHADVLEVFRQKTHQRENHRVYVTKDLATAANFARIHPQTGDVYQVEPLGNLEDSTGAFSFSQTTCDRARIVAVVMKRVTWEQVVLAATEARARRKATT